MKKLALFVTAALLLAGLSEAAPAKVKIMAGYLYPQDKDFRDIYGGGITYGFELSSPVSRNLEMWIEGGYFSRAGRLTYTKEKTTLRIVPVGGGIRYLFSTDRWKFQAGLGLDYFFFRESNVLGTVLAGKLGLAGTIGSNFALSEKILIDMWVRYSYCQMKPEDLKFNVGGLGAGVGLAYRF
jgi:opacity protein-like surface antigen